MVDAVTVNRSLVVQATGANVGTWGTVSNGNYNLLDTIVGGLTSISTTGGSTTLNAAQLACGTISVSGALSSNAQLYFPSVQGWWSIENLTTGSFVLQVCAAGASATQIIAVPPGEITDIQINGTVAKFRNLGRVGVYEDIADATVPAWITSCTVPPYLNCDGTTFSAATYPYLNTKLGGNTLPDLRGGSRATLNQGTGRITTAGSGVDGNTRFSRGGVETQGLTLPQLPSATLSQNNTSSVTVIARQSSGVTSPGSGANIYLDIMQTTGGGGTSSATYPLNQLVTVALGGSNTPHNNLQPTTIAGITLIRAA